MKRQEKISEGYQKAAGTYDSLLSAQSLWSQLVVKIVWGFSDTAYTDNLLERVSDDFNGSLLDVPVGTAMFTVSKYGRMKQAQITCLDYSPAMMRFAIQRFTSGRIANATCLQGDVGTLPFDDHSFDILLSMNGFHAFSDKETAFQETARVLKSGGRFIGCFYVQGESKRTDWFINHFYVPRGYFTPPFLSKKELENKLHMVYREVDFWSIGSIACFNCVK